VFVGTWSADKPTEGATAVRLGPGVSDLLVEGLRIRGYVTGVQAAAAKDGAVKDEGVRTRVTFNDVDIEQFRYGFYLSDCHFLRLNACDLKRYTKHGFRLDSGCKVVTLMHCTADCSEGDAEWEKKTELLPFGFTVNDGGKPNSQVTFRECTARNNLMPLQKNSYKNGDGFVVEASAGPTTLVNCHAIRNQDGGFDLKPADLTLEGCTAIGNSKGFRIWTTAKLTNCFAGWGSVGLWANGGPVDVTRSTFHELKAAVMTDDRAKEPVTLTDCLLSSVETPHKKTSHGKVEIEASVTATKGDAEQDPQFVRPDPQWNGQENLWNGQGDAMNSRKYLDKGYRRAATEK
jgi:hypothetical protein